MTEMTNGVSRRGFLGALFAGTGAAVVAASGCASDAQVSHAGQKAILFDSSRCVGCHYCESSCKKANNLDCKVTINIKALADTFIPRSMIPTESWESSGAAIKVDDRAYNRWLRVVDPSDEGAPSLRHACLHCGLCAEVCPSGAITRREDGIVAVDPEKCIGCKYCFQACPFDIPRYNKGENGADKAMYKCSMCAGRVDEGKQPACVEACPMEALRFGTFDEMVAQGKAEVARLQQAGFAAAELYGDDEVRARGTGVLYVVAHGASKAGLPAI